MILPAGTDSVETRGPSEIVLQIVLVVKSAPARASEEPRNSGDETETCL